MDYESPIISSSKFPKFECVHGLSARSYSCAGECNTLSAIILQSRRALVHFQALTWMFNFFEGDWQICMLSCLFFFFSFFHQSTSLCLHPVYLSAFCAFLIWLSFHFFSWCLVCWLHHGRNGQRQCAVSRHWSYPYLNFIVVPFVCVFWFNPSLYVLLLLVSGCYGWKWMMNIFFSVYNH